MNKITKEEHFLEKQILYTRIQLDNNEYIWLYKSTEVRVPHHISVSLENKYSSTLKLEKEVD